MKKLFALFLVIVTVFAMSSCGMEGIISQLGEGSPSGKTNSKNKELIGTWELEATEVTEEGAEGEGSSDIEIDFGFGIEFTKDGKLRYGLTEEVLASIESGENAEELLAGMEFLITIYYEVVSDTELKLTVSAMMGLAKETQTVEYSLDGDTLIFDGATYKRVK